MAREAEFNKSEHDASVAMLAAVIASGGQIVVDKRQLEEVRNHRLMVHKSGNGDIYFTAVSRNKYDTCELCDGLGGYAIVGSTGPGQVCPKCNGAGVNLSPT